MISLKLKPLNKKNLHVLLARKTHYEPWWFDSPNIGDDHEFSTDFNPPLSYLTAVKCLARKESVDLVTTEKGNSGAMSPAKHPLGEGLSELGIPFRLVGIDEGANSYLLQSIELKQTRYREILENLKLLDEAEKTIENMEKFERISKYGEYLHDRIEEEQQDLDFAIQEKWIAMRILNEARNINKRRVRILHLCSPSHLQGLTTILQNLGVRVTPVTLHDSVSEMRRSIFREHAPIQDYGA